MAGCYVCLPAFIIFIVNCEELLHTSYPCKCVHDNSQLQYSAVAEEVLACKPVCTHCKYDAYGRGWGVPSITQTVACTQDKNYLSGANRQTWENIIHERERGVIWTMSAVNWPQIGYLPVRGEYS
jgi:hypothetical protein